MTYEMNKVQKGLELLRHPEVELPETVAIPYKNLEASVKTYGKLESENAGQQKLNPVFQEIRASVDRIFVVSGRAHAYDPGAAVAYAVTAGIRADSRAYNIMLSKLPEDLRTLVEDALGQGKTAGQPVDYHSILAVKNKKKSQKYSRKQLKKQRKEKGWKKKQRE